jgi:hypothetical protein
MLHAQAGVAASVSHPLPVSMYVRCFRVALDIGSTALLDGRGRFPPLRRTLLPSWWPMWRDVPSTHVPVLLRSRRSLFPALLTRR